MLPLITIGTFSISTYALMYALAALVGGVVALRNLRGLPGNQQVYRDGLVLIVAGIFLGMMLPGWIVALVRILNGEPAGTIPMRVYYGTTAAVLIGIYYFPIRHHLSALKPLDRVVPAFALGYAIARLGCLAAGCCGGSITSSALGMYTPDNQGHWADRYPTQLMSLLFQVGLFFLFTWLNRESAQDRLPGWLRRGALQRGALKRDGVLFFGYTLLFCLERFLLEFLRYDYQPITGPFSPPQLWMLAWVVVGLVGVGYGMAKPSRTADIRR